MFSGSLGVPELLLVLAIVLLVLGPKRLPGLGRQLGRGLREFKDSVTGRHDEATGLERGEDAAATTKAAAAAEAPPKTPA